MDFELKVDVRNKLKLDALKLCKFRDSGFEMYRLLSIEYDKYNMDSEGLMSAELLTVVSSSSQSVLRFRDWLGCDLANSRLPLGQPDRGCQASPFHDRLKLFRTSVG